MFKRIKESEKYQKFQELWANERTHSMIVLGFWFVFLGILILFIKLNSVTSVSPSNVNKMVSNFDSINSYDFSYVQGNNELHGSYYDNKMLFVLNNHKYYYNKNIYLINGDVSVVQNFDLGWLKINSRMLNNLISGINGTEVADYIQYIVPLDRFINLYEIDTDVDLTKVMGQNIILNVYKKDNSINKIVIDLTSYRIFRFSDSNPYILSLYFYNLNKVNDFTSDFEKIVGGIK